MTSHRFLEIKTRTPCDDRKKIVTHDITVLPDGGDIVVCVTQPNHARGSVKRIALDGKRPRIVWAEALEKTSDLRACYSPGVKKLVVLKVSLDRGVTSQGKCCLSYFRHLCWMTMDGQLDGTFASYIKFPVAICAHSGDQLYVLSAVNNRVHLIDLSRDVEIGSFAVDIKYHVAMDYATLCCLEDGTVVVCAWRQRELQAYSPTGELQWKYGDMESIPGHIPRRGMCAAPGGGLYVSVLSSRVEKINNRGQYVCDVITKADGLDRPQVVAMSKDGQLVVAEFQKGPVKVFDLPVQ